MATKNYPIVLLSEMEDGQEADLFALLTVKEELRTREGKRYFRVTFRDALREVTFPVWGDSPLAAECRTRWAPGAFYKLRAFYRDTSYGPQLEIVKIRETCATDAADGFDPLMCVPQSRHAPSALFDELLALVKVEVPGALGELTRRILLKNRETLLTLPAAVYHHHAYVGGFLEHSLSVARTCLYLADKYCEQYPDLTPPLDRGLVVAGGVLHDIGKLREMQTSPTGSEYTPAGSLLGHLVLGRDVIREAASDVAIDPETMLRLEHIVVAHQTPEWGSPKPPMTPEALLVHYADDIDARFQMMYQALRDDSGQGPMTGSHHPLRQPIFRGSLLAVG